MPQRTLSCQLPSPRTGDSRLISPHPSDHNTPTPTLQTEHPYDYSADQVALVYGEAAQHVQHTKSRRSGPRRWRGAVVWLIAAGLHPRANATTLRVADDLAARMDYDTGHVRYCLKDMVARLGIPRSTIAKHIAFLRELGALAWVQHGSKTNIRARMGLKGYAATATVYAAVIPPAYDHAMGHTIVGSGYTARIIIDQRQTPQPVDNSPVENPTMEDRETPSLTWVKKKDQVQVVGGSNYTSQARHAKNPIPHQSSQKNGRRRTAADVQKAGKTIRLVRALVNWTQSVPLRRLEYVLRPWTDQGWDALRIADELNGMCAGVRWKPRRPDHFIRARIAADTQHREQLATAIPWEESTAYREQQAARASLEALLASEPAELPKLEYTAEEKARARMDWNNWPEVADHYDDDPDDALDLYGQRLCAYAVGKQARMDERQGAWA